MEFGFENGPRWVRYGNGPVHDAGGPPLQPHQVRSNFVLEPEKPAGEADEPASQ